MVRAQLVEEEYFELPLLIKFGRALFNAVVTSCVWVFRMVVTWASPSPSVSRVIGAFAFAALTRIKGTYSREAGELNLLPSGDAGKLSAVVGGGESGPVGLPKQRILTEPMLAEGTDVGGNRFSPKDQTALGLCELGSCSANRKRGSPSLRSS